MSVDGGPPEQTPLFVPRLSAGRHTPRVFRTSYKPQNVEIRDGDTRRVHVVLDREAPR